MTTSQVRRAAAWLAVLGIPALITGWDLVRDRGIARFHDNFTTYAPLRLEVGRQWSDGRIPVWNPYKRAGAPLLGDSVSAALYPPNLLFAATREESSLWTLDVLAALHHLLAGGAAYVFLRTLRLGRLPAVMGSLVYSLGGFCALVTARWIALQNALAWAPLVLACLERTRRPRRLWLWAGIGALLYAIQLLAGYPEFSFYTGLLCVSYALMMILREPERWYRPVAAVLAIGVGGVLLAAPQLLPTLVAFTESTRPGTTPYDEFIRFSADPLELLSLGLPGAAFRVSNLYLGNGLLYVGAPALVFAGAALRRLDALTIWASLVVLLSVVLILGPNSPVGAVAHSIPGFNAFRWPFKHAFELTLGISVLAAVGLQRFLDGERGARAGAVALAIVSAGLAFVAAVMAPRVSPMSLIVHGGLALLVAGFALRARPGVAALAAIALLALCVAWNRAAMLDRVRARPVPRAPSSELVGRLAADAGSRLLLLRQRWGRSTLVGDLATALRIPAVHGAGPYLWRPLADALAMDDIGFIADNQVLRPGEPALDLLAVRYLLYPRSRETADREALLRAQPAARFEEWPAGLLVTRSTALPFAYLVDRVACEPAGAAADPRETAAITCTRNEDAPETATSAGRAELRRLEPGLVELAVQVEGPARGFLVLSQPDYPGWSASSDGQPTPIRRVHGLVQGVWLSPGQHHVRLRYRAPGFGPGLLLAGGSLLFFAVLIRCERRPGGASRRPGGGGDTDGSPRNAASLLEAHRTSRLGASSPGRRRRVTPSSSAAARTDRS